MAGYERDGEGREPPRRSDKDHGNKRKEQSNEERAAKDKGKAIEEVHKSKKDKKKNKKQSRDQRAMRKAIATADADDAARHGGRASAFSIREPGSQEGHSTSHRRSTRGRPSPNETEAQRRRKRAHIEDELDAEPEPLLNPA